MRQRACRSCRRANAQLTLEPFLNNALSQIGQDSCGSSNGFSPDGFRSSSPSLSGRVGVKRFQTAPSRRSDVGCHSQGPRFSSGSALGPSHDGIRRMRRTNLPTRPCRKTYGRQRTRNGLASSIVPAGTSLHRRRNSGFLLLYFYCAQLAVRFPVMWRQLLLWSNETRCHPPTCDA
jgi:hypothetical protein